MSPNRTVGGPVPPQPALFARQVQALPLRGKCGGSEIHALQTEPRPRSSPARERLITFLKILVLGVFIFFLIRQCLVHWQDIREHEWTVRFEYLIPSYAVGFLTFIIMAGVWRQLIAAFGHRVRIRDAFRIFYLADLGRYVPGKVWAFLGVLYLSRQKGIPPEQAGASFVMVQMFAIPASFFIFIVAAQLEPYLLQEQISFLGEKSSYVLTGLMVLFCVFLVTWPQKVQALANAFLRRLRRPEVDFKLDKKVALLVFVGYCIGWTCYGSAFWLFVQSVVPQAGLSPIAGIGLFNAAYQIGYLTLIAPGGFGPRELVMGTMLTPFVGPIGPAVAIAARLWVMLLEATAAAGALAMRK